MSATSRAAWAVVLAAVVGSVLPAAPATAAGDTGIAVVAHRGNSGAAPENTLSSLTQAVAERADYVEFDVRLTRDGVPVVLHDMSLARTTDVEQRFPARRPWNVQDFTSAEVQKLDAGGWKAASYAGEHVPALRAALRELALGPSGAFVEVKEPAVYGGVDGIGVKVHDALHQQWPQAFADPSRPRVLVQSFDADFVRAYAAKYPGDPVSVISPPTPPEEVKAYAQDMQVYYRSITPDLADDAHSLGLTIGAYTIDDPAVMGQLASENLVDNVTSDYPDRLRGVLAGAGRSFGGTQWPDRSAAKPTWRLTTGGTYLNTRIPLSARLTLPDGSPARWQRAVVQKWQDGAWVSILNRATDADGSFATNLAGTTGLRVRVVSGDDVLYPAAVSPSSSVPLVRMASRLTVGGTASVRPRHAAHLKVRWRAADGRALTGTARLYTRRAGGAWHFVRSARVSAGLRSLTVHPRHTQQYQVRGGQGWWYRSAIGSTRVRVTR